MKKIIFGIIISLLNFNLTYAGDSWLLDMSFGKKIIFYCLTIGIPIIILYLFSYSSYKLIKKEKINKLIKILDIIFLLILLIFIIIIFININL